MWQIRLFGKASQYDDITSQDYIDDTRDQWTPLFSVSGKFTYKDVDSITVKCQTKFKNGDSVLVAYGEDIVMFGYITRSITIVTDAQYEYVVIEYLNKLSKYPVPRFGTTTYNQIVDRNTSMKSRIDNISYPGGKKTIKEFMDAIMVGAGTKWSHEVNDYYYNNNMAKCELDIMGPYYRWGKNSISSIFTKNAMKTRWYDIPNFTQIPGIYGQLPTVPNYDMIDTGVEYVVKLKDPDDPYEMMDQICQIVWTPDEDDDKDAKAKALLEFKKGLVSFIPTMELCTTTVWAGVRRLLLDLCKMNVWVVPKFKGGDFVFDTPIDAGDAEYIDDVTFVVQYGYVRDQKITDVLQYIQYRSNDSADDTMVECVLVIGQNRKTDIGMAVTPNATVPYTTAIWEYADGRNTAELDALAKQIMDDLQTDTSIIELDMPPGIPWYEGEFRIEIGDVIRIQHESFVDYHKANGWYDGSNNRYTKRMNALCNMMYLSGDRNERLFTVKGIRMSISGTTLELEDSKGDIFSIMGDRIKRIEGTSQEYDIDYWVLAKSDITLIGRPTTEYGYTNTEEGSLDYGNVYLTNKLPTDDGGIPSKFKSWDGSKWIYGTKYTSMTGYPAWTSMLLKIEEEDDMTDIPNGRGIVPLKYIGPWFNVEIQVLGSKPSLTQDLNDGNLSLNNLSAGNAWVIPYQYDVADAVSVVALKSYLDDLESKGQYEYPSAKSRIPQNWLDSVYFECETDCMIAPEFIQEAIINSGSLSMNCLNYLKVGPIPKGYDNVKITANISFADYIYAEYSGDKANTLDATISSRGLTAKSCFTFNFQWCMGHRGRPRSTTFDPNTKAHRQGYWDGGGVLINDLWDDDPDVIYDGSWNKTNLNPTWAPDYGIQTATLHTDFDIADKRVENAIEDMSLYLRYVVVFNSFRTTSAYMYNFGAMTGWEISVVCTPGYELLDEWYKARMHKIQLLVSGTGKWTPTYSIEGVYAVSTIIDWPDDEFINEDGYFCFDIRKFIGTGNNYVRMRSIKEIVPGLYSTGELKIRASYISGWLKE